MMNRAAKILYNMRLIYFVAKDNANTCASFYLSRCLAVVLLFLYVTTQLSVNAVAWSPEKAARARMLSDSQTHSLSAADLNKISRNITSATAPSSSLSKRSSGNASTGIQRSSRNGTPFFIGRDALSQLSGGLRKPTAGVTPVDYALNFLKDNAHVFFIENPHDELIVQSNTTDGSGNVHLQFSQTYKDLPVWNHQLVMHLDATGYPYAVNGRYAPTPSGIDAVSSGVTSSAAIEYAASDLTSTAVIRDLDDSMKSLLGYNGPQAELVITIDESDNVPRLAWHVLIRPNPKDLWHYFIDALTGEILEKYNATSWQTSITASAADALDSERVLNVALENGTYYLYDIAAEIFTYDSHGTVITENNYPTLVQSTDNTWTDPIAVSAHANAREVYDYYLERHGRKGVDDNGIILPVVVHFTVDGEPLANAFWNGRFIAFGDAVPYAAALDVVAHELTHGVVQYTVGLEYQYQSGALNESISDVMAAMIDPDWEIGEDLPDGAIRDLENPGRFRLPSHMDEYYNMSLNQDYGGVHVNTSIPSRAAYLVAESIGRDKTADIWYKILSSRYLTPKSIFVDMRFAAVQAAEDLYGEESEEVAVVISAFDYVGILESERPKPPADREPPSGENLIAFVYEYQNQSTLALAEPVLQSEEDIFFPAEVNVYTGGSSPITVCNEESRLIYIDMYNNMRSIDLDTFEETIIDDSGIWSSVKISPDGCMLAATTVDPDTTIYIFDMDDPENTRKIQIYTASTEGVRTNTALFADALDWDSKSEIILYDAYHNLPLENGNAIDFWDVNMLDVETGIITRVKTPTDNGIQVGNPSYAKTNDRFIVCDLFSEELQGSGLVTIDLYSMDIELLRDNGMIRMDSPNLGHPKYSPDDSAIIFHQYSFWDQAYVLYKLPLNDDKMTASDSETPYFYGVLPVWFVKQDIPLSTGDVGDSVAPHAVFLHPNYPNPFNPYTTLSFSMLNDGFVSLTLYDILGRKIRTILEELRPAGSHEIRFDATDLPSGTYLYTLAANGKTMTRKMSIIK